MRPLTILGFAAGLALGVLVGFVLWNADGPGEPGAGPLDGERPGSGLADSGTPVLPAVPAGSVEPMAADSPPPVGDDDGRLITQALLDYARQTYLDSSQQTFGYVPTEDRVEDALEAFQQECLQLPRLIAGRHFQARADDRERARSIDEALQAADGVALLQLVQAGDYELTDQSAAALVDRIVPGRGGGAVLSASAFDGDASPELVPGTTIQFGPGVHHFDMDKLRLLDEFPTDITFAGAGMDTTLVSMSDMVVGGDVERLTLRDMTIDCENDGLFDLRSGKLVLDVLRTRLVRFDAGHGGAVLFSARSGAMVRVAHSEILGGFGKSPGNGRLFRSGPLLTHIIDSRLELLDPTFTEVSHGVFERCTIDRITPNDLADVDRMELVSCLVGPPLTETVTEVRDLAELFPELD